MDQMARGRAGDDHPVEEIVAPAQSQAARRVPVGPAEEVETPFGVLGERVASFRLRPAEIERHAAGDATIESGRDGGRVAAAGDRAEQDDPLRVDALPREQQVDAAHQVPGHPAHQAVAQELQLHSAVVPEIVVLPTSSGTASHSPRRGETDARGVLRSRPDR